MNPCDWLTLTGTLLEGLALLVLALHGALHRYRLRRSARNQTVHPPSLIVTAEVGAVDVKTDGPTPTLEERVDQLERQAAALGRRLTAEENDRRRAVNQLRGELSRAIAEVLTEADQTRRRNERQEAAVYGWEISAAVLVAAGIALQVLAVVRPC